MDNNNKMSIASAPAVAPEEKQISILK